MGWQRGEPCSRSSFGPANRVVAIVLGYRLRILTWVKYAPYVSRQSDLDRAWPSDI